MKGGFAHLALATHDMDATIGFYENCLGYPRVAETHNRAAGGGVVRMVYFDLGDGEFLVFMEAKGVPTIPENFDTGINRGLGLPDGMYHLALAVDSVDELARLGDRLRKKGVEVSDEVDHGYARSIYLRDPNGIQLEYCIMTREFGPDDLQRVDDVVVANPVRSN
ncbi:VOC family protein [Rubinisphaera sp.]|mgnify:CR=1 FL=1|uniref:VOC family protein n=1 Tax=Rubinisphaera sp. TaxID=2024857 RepID=UPI000C0DCE51|nr:VOC family protein [Rubinisphaera sp.]MBV08672.1 hypothetical protein [Rubinisphaera sp.]|tara:strand:- start:829 stop:1323 length:495 start_codon:yes stop_codon:yes gene_type:complete